MNTMVFYLGSSALLGLAAILIRGTSPFSPTAYYAYESKRKRWLIGVILLIMAAFSFGIGALSQFFSSYH